MPQLYSKLGPNYPVRATADWRAAGFPIVSPVLGGSSAHSAAEMRTLADWTPNPDNSISWWDFYHLFTSTAAARARVVRDYTAPATALVA